MGIDPGLARTGYGVIEVRGSRLRHVDNGCVETHPSENMIGRLEEVFERIEALLATHRPDEVAVEQLFFSNNARTAFMVGQARGVILLALSKAGVALGEYTPLEVKQSVVGYGNAAKGQIQYMVKAILGLAEAPRPDDAADALALAICHAHLRDRAALLREAR
jgi:crossover junction endodeoxyribonuclease RuvC